MEFGGKGGFFKSFLEGSVDHIIYRGYIVNRRFFIYCSLACPSTFPPPPKASSALQGALNCILFTCGKDSHAALTCAWHYGQHAVYHFLLCRVEVAESSIAKTNVCRKLWAQLSGSFFLTLPKSVTLSKRHYLIIMMMMVK